MCQSTYCQLLSAAPPFLRLFICSHIFLLKTSSCHSLFRNVGLVDNAFGFLEFSLLQHGIPQLLKARSDYPIKKTIRCRLILKLGFQKAHAPPALGTMASGMLPDIHVIPTGQNPHAPHQWFANETKPPVSRITPLNEIQSAIAANHIVHQTPSLVVFILKSGCR